jgi:hypothetical protein
MTIEERYRLARMKVDRFERYAALDRLFLLWIEWNNKRYMEEGIEW